MRLPYGTGSLRIPDRFLRGAKILRPLPARPVRAPTIRRILRGLARWARSGRRVLVVVPDRTRYAAVERTLPILNRLS